MEEKTTISTERYKELIQTERFMAALEAAGVDNWEGYEFAIDALGEENDD